MIFRGDGEGISCCLNSIKGGTTDNLLPMRGS